MTNLSKRIIFKSRMETDNEFDFYPTPKWGTEMLLDHLALPKNYKILEPCNGTGSMSDVLKEKGYKVKTFDIDTNAVADNYLDFLQYNKTNEFDAIITNPPFKFNAKMEFVQKALDIVKPGGIVAMLSQITKLEGQRRKKFYDENVMKTVLIHSKRYNIGGKVGIGYAWFIWEKGFKGDTIIKII